MHKFSHILSITQHCLSLSILIKSNWDLKQPDILHSVIDSETRGDDSARRIEVEVDWLRGVLGFEEKELRDDEGGGAIVDRPVDAHDALLQEAREDVIGALAAGSVLDHHRHEAIVAARWGSGGGGGDDGGEEVREAAPEHVEVA